MMISDSDVETAFRQLPGSLQTAFRQLSGLPHPHIPPNPLCGSSFLINCKWSVYTDMGRCGRNSASLPVSRSLSLSFSLSL